MKDTEFPGLVNEITKYLPEGPAYFPDDMITDQPERIIAAEMIREKVLRSTRDEVPHSIAVEIDEFKVVIMMIFIFVPIFLWNVNPKKVL